MGYLLYPVTALGLGTWGRMQPPGTGEPASRGTLDPALLGFPPPGTYRALSLLPLGTPGNCVSPAPAGENAAQNTGERSSPFTHPQLPARTPARAVGGDLSVME